jgi:hypothetical protein
MASFLNLRLIRGFGKRKPTGLGQPPQRDESATGSPSSTSERSSPENAVAPATISEVLKIEEVSDAAFFIGDLFRRRFRCEAPTFPRHYVAFYRESSARYVPVGYVHYTQFEDSYLCGGLVIDERLYRHIPLQDRRVIRQAGGIAEVMLRDTLARLREAVAIWGYVGDKQAEAVDVRAGFRRTTHSYLMVVWNRDVPEDERDARLVRISALGPF